MRNLPFVRNGAGPSARELTLEVQLLVSVALTYKKYVYSWLGIPCHCHSGASPGDYSTDTRNKSSLVKALCKYGGWSQPHMKVKLTFGDSIDADMTEDIRRYFRKGYSRLCKFT